MQRYFDKTVPDAVPGEVAREVVYQRLNFPPGVDHPVRRPYVAINMVSTVDGKVVIGGPGTTGLIGSATDHYLMGRIEFQADGVLLGAGLVRDDDPPYPSLTDEQRRAREALGLRPNPLWAIVSTRGHFDRLPRVFAGGRENTAVFVSQAMTAEQRARLEPHTQVFVAGSGWVEPSVLGRILRDELQVRRLVCLGGPTLNATLCYDGAADELFVTLAPKLQGGSRMPTLLEGAGYPPAALPKLELLSLYGDGSELYLRYKLPPADVLRMRGSAPVVHLDVTRAPRARSSAG